MLAEGLTRRWGDKVALDHLDLAVPRGVVFGLLGPNGAGKTTCVRILTTLLRPTGGRAVVGGHDVVAEPRAARHRIGLTGQEPAVDEILSARRNLEMFGRLFHLDARRARHRAGELLERFGLTEAADRAPGTFSGGMRRRLDLAASMILAPEVLFLDEPTTGLDPRGRMEVWEAIRELARAGTTVLLTTHYLDEADRLSDRIALVDNGRKVVEDTPIGLKRAIGGDRIEVVAREPADLPAVAAVLARVADAAAPVVEEHELRVHASVRDRIAALTEVTRELHARGTEVEDIGLRRPTLDEVFLRVTGSSAVSVVPTRTATEEVGR
ncbi:ATP-binding cassette domain-containing protein [Streptomyces sp. ST2-7A]|uniref:ATP-binding cassette domain-containing protein n=1 Tax=Streptomyces sp. ST2-7A TaxID=2907214 RepID=UPI001F296350|nr:ATP-binding cassette domain-containing protein [Streptomyces sp. ST2-7A]MCE7079065.1 ATP-binding cassette domain-containing protein [Streptomyces sp. ST2-7A]